MPLFVNTNDPSTFPLLDELQGTLPRNESTLLSIDSELQSQIFQILRNVSLDAKYAGGSGIIMDVETGELLSLVSYTGEPSLPRPVSNKATQGLYIPGSIVKPFVALAALNENIIDPETEILSTGSITVPNPYQPGEPYIYKDWKAHGYVDMREAIGVSSNVYFYTIGGGYKERSGLGIENIKTYLQAFGIGHQTGITGLTESAGQIPDPAWKATTFNTSEWQLGDTYLTAIGQHGYAVTPIQMVRAVAAIATEGTLPTPTIFATSEKKETEVPISITQEHYQIVREGMRYAVTNGTAAGLYQYEFPLAAKTGTAEADPNREHIHSWLIGYFPTQKPRYAFVFMLENGPWGEETGAVAVAHDVFRWIEKERPYYIKQQ